MVEQRKSQRKVFRTSVVVAMATGQTFQGRSYDIAIGGMAVVTSVQLERACSSVLGFDLPDGQSVERLHLQARLVYSQPCAEGFKNGLQFMEVDSDAAASLSRYLDGAA